MLLHPTKTYTIISEEAYADEMQKIVAALAQYENSGYFLSADGKKMYYEFFKVENPVGNIIIVHGYTEFTKKYYELTWYYMHMGYNVFLFDLRGHGNSHRDVENLEMTHVDKFEDYVSDLDCYVQQIVAPNSDAAPLYIYAHSMGATVSMLYITRYENAVKRAVLSAPMVYPFTPPLPRFMLKKLLTGEARKFGWHAKFKFSHDFNPNVNVEKSNDASPSRFKYNLDLRIQNLQYRNTSSTNRWNFEAVTVIEKALNKNYIQKAYPNVLLISAGQDTSVKVAPQKKLAKLLKCNYKVYPNAKHSLYTQNEAELREYLETVLGFFAE